MTPAGNDEVLRRLDVLERLLRDLPGEIDRTYARKDVIQARDDVFTARETATAVQLRGIEEEQHSINKRLDAADERRETEYRTAADRRAADRRLILASVFTALIGPVVVALIVAAMHQ